MSQEKSLTELSADYELAKTEFENADREARLARNRATDFLNAVNRAQQALHAHFEKLRKEAPHESDWKRRQSFSENEAL